MGQTEWVPAGGPVVDLRQSAMARDGRKSVLRLGGAKVCFR